MKEQGAKRKSKSLFIGIGGGGTNSLKNFAAWGARDCLAINTDRESLEAATFCRTLIIGSIKKGGTKGDTDVGRMAAIKALARIRKELAGYSSIFILAGLGGGTGSGAAPVVLQEALKQAQTVMAAVTLPFSFESQARNKTAKDSLARMQKLHPDILVLSNDLLMDLAKKSTSKDDVFALGDREAFMLLNERRMKEY
ncbi:MAG: hypothetical protein QMD09_09795 [Desulfatibacillaceae bacterium]|nr:hypothetical protein [Desulfatibacillaceae bacterium]